MNIVVCVKRMPDATTGRKFKGGHYESAKGVGDSIGAADDASVAAVKSGWLPSYARQVTQTSQKVSPQIHLDDDILYAVHRGVGMKTSKTAVADYRDPKDPTLELVDSGVAGQLISVLPAAIEQIFGRER